MNVLELMDDVIHALNQLPNTRLSGRFRNTYALVAALEQAQRQNGIRLEIRGEVRQEPVRADFAQGIRVELFDHADGGQSAVTVVGQEEVGHG
ncbi:MAG TPA: hypothetical protein PLE99_10270 [Candidatus Thiothrix moscowensis]|uniref:hypothetical protein n=1 Tax=Thiothrix sp. UBA2016 TaxID=1947695 RepID=UPI0025FEB18F|nr:hypothetical protein [Thiothrix sp. UBA2016]HRJ53145.1 hypothetical protein [Candidatus Thiothrix moscowensis]HRJ93136.1 hypothetical protein [Candidatus Thiothrix moscowensis]